LRKALTVPGAASLIAGQTYDAIFKNRRALPETFATKGRGHDRLQPGLLKSRARGRQSRLYVTVHVYVHREQARHETRARDFRDCYRKLRGGSSLPAGSAAHPREGSSFHASAFTRRIRQYRLLLRRGTMSCRTQRIKDRQYCATAVPAAAILMAIARTCDSTLSGVRAIMTRLFNNARVTGIRNQTGRTRAATRADRTRRKRARTRDGRVVG